MKQHHQVEQAQDRFVDKITQLVFAISIVCLAGLVTTSSALAQNSKVNSKLSEEALQRETEDTGWPLTIRRAPDQQRLADRYIVVFRPQVAVSEPEAGDLQ